MLFETNNSFVSVLSAKWYWNNLFTVWILAVSETEMLISSGHTEFHSYRNGCENKIEDGLSNGEHFVYIKMNGATFFNKDV